MYPQDIEISVEHAHSLIRPGCVIAFSIMDPDEQLVVVCELSIENPSPEEIDAVVKNIRYAL